MNVFGKSFTFDGVNSSDYGVVLCSFERIDTNRETSISYTLQTGDITPSRPIANYYNKKYREPLSFRIVISKACSILNHFSVEEQQKIVQWLTSPIDYRKCAKNLLNIQYRN